MSDFTNVVDIAGVFVADTEDTDVDFVAIGDQGLIIIAGYGFGEGGFGQGPFGGTQTVILSSGTTTWTNISTP